MKRSTSILVLLALFAFVYAEEAEAEAEEEAATEEHEVQHVYSIIMSDGRLEAILDKCAKETHASEEDAEAIASFELPEGHEGNCMINCIHRNYGIVDARGIFNRNGLMMLIEPLKRSGRVEEYNNIIKLVQKCEREAQFTNDPCQNGRSIMECMHDHEEEFGFGQ